MRSSKNKKMSNSSSNPSKNEYFIKQRDLLIQEISNNLSIVQTNLETLNRSLHELKQIGKEFDDVARLWSTFYDGMNGMNHQTRENTRDENNKISSSDTEDENNNNKI